LLPELKIVNGRFHFCEVLWAKRPKVFNFFDEMGLVGKIELWI
jgi:hypothetical protein